MCVCVAWLRQFFAFLFFVFFFAPALLFAFYFVKLFFCRRKSCVWGGVDIYFLSVCVILNVWIWNCCWLCVLYVFCMYGCMGDCVFCVCFVCVLYVCFVCMFRRHENKQKLLRLEHENERMKKVLFNRFNLTMQEIDALFDWMNV